MRLFLVFVLSFLTLSYSVNACDFFGLTINSITDCEGNVTINLSACVEPDNMLPGGGSRPPNGMYLTVNGASNILSYTPTSVSTPAGVWSVSQSGNVISWSGPTFEDPDNTLFCVDIELIIPAGETVTSITFGDGNNCSETVTNIPPSVSLTPTITGLPGSTFDCTDNTNYSLSVEDGSGGVFYPNQFRISVEQDNYSDDENSIQITSDAGTDLAWGPTNTGANYQGTLGSGGTFDYSWNDVPVGTTVTVDWCDDDSWSSFGASGIFEYSGSAPNQTFAFSGEFNHTHQELQCFQTTFGPLNGSGSFSGNGVTDGGTVAGTNVGTFNPSGLAPGVHTITYSYDNGYGCLAEGTLDVTITCLTPCDPTWAATTLCETDGVVELTTLVTGDAGGTWSGTGVSGTNFDPTGLSGAITVTYTLATCSESHDFTVDAAPDPSWTTTTVCESSGNLDLTALVTGDAGGTWSGTGVSGTDFDPSGGTQSVTYTVTNGLCTEVSTQNITVDTDPDPSWNPATVCENGGLIDLTTYVTGTPGGTWSGTGVSGTDFDPSTLNGAISLTYSVTNGTCTQFSTQNMTVDPCIVPCDPTWAATSLCETDGVVDLTTLVTGDPGGTWSGTGVSGTNFDPTGLSGNITVTYTLASCSEAHDFVVDAAPVATWNSTTVCENGGLFDLTTLVTGDAGGTWSGTGVTGTDFDPSTLNGAISLTYSVTNGLCTEFVTQNIVVSPCTVCNPTWAATNLCEADGIVDLTTLVTGDPGGTWSGTGVTGTNFDPTGLSGLITVTYDLGGGCIESHDFNVDASPNAAWTATATCQSAGILDLTTLVTGTPGGTWTGIGVTGTNFDPSTLSGPIAVQYQVTNGLCTETLVQNITVNTIDDASFDYPSATYCATDVDPTATNVAMLGGTFTEGTGNIVFVDPSNGEIDLSASTPGGPYTITYTTVGVCSNSATFDVSIDAAPDPSWTTTSVCQTSGLLDLTTLVTGDAGGTWSGTGVAGTDFDPSGQLGSITLTYSVTNGICTEQSSQNLIVTASADPTWTAVGPFCLTEPSFDLNTLVTGTAGGSWTINGVAENTFDAASLGVGTHTVVYSVGVAPCSGTLSQDIIVEGDPDPSWTPISPQCIDAGVTDLNTVVTGDAGGVWSGTGMNGSNFDPSVFSTTGQTAITYTVTSVTGCTADSTDTLYYIGLPDPTFTMSDVCEGEVLSLTHIGSITPTTTFTWDFGTLNAFGAGTGYYDLGSPVVGNYPVSLTVEDQGCTSMIFTVDADVHPAVSASATVTNVACNGNCDGEISMTALTGTYIGQPDYLWNTGNIGATQSALCAGMYNVTVTDDNGCQVVYDIEVQEPDPIQVDTIMYPVSCFGLSDGGADMVIIGGTPVVNVQWSDGSIGTTLTGVPEGSYDYTVQDANGCQSAGTIEVTQPAPVLDGQSVSHFADQYYVHNGIKFDINGTLGFTSYDWLLDGSTISQDSSFTYEFDAPGSYDIDIIVEREGCYDTLITSLVIEEPFRVFVADAFTPGNRDGLNDEFRPIITLTDTYYYEFLIYNRWGELLFSTNDPLESWRGLDSNGEPYQQDVYVYKLTLEANTGERTKRVGHVALIR